jgi:hypothetical protein
MNVFSRRAGVCKAILAIPFLTACSENIDDAGRQKTDIECRKTERMVPAVAFQQCHIQPSIIRNVAGFFRQHNTGGCYREIQNTSPPIIAGFHFYKAGIKPEIL